MIIIVFMFSDMYSEKRVHATDTISRTNLHTDIFSDWPQCKHCYNFSNLTTAMT